MRSILLLLLVARCIDTIYVCIWRMFVFMSIGMNIVQVVLSGFSVRLFCFVQAQLYVGMVVCISWLHSCLCVDVMVTSSA